MQIKLIPLLLFACAAHQAAAADTLHIQRRIAAEQTALRPFFPLPLINPALKRFQSSGKLTEIKAETEYGREKEAITVQEGDGREMYGMAVRSFVPHAGGSLWGDASYRKGVKYGMKLNETSDGALLYPYLTGDTIGGDMQSEIYAFSGGYAAGNNRFTWGINAAFRATQEYRAVDPRPGNIASQLDCSAGAALHWGNNYLAGAALHLQKYRQKNEIAFYNELGDVKVYHYTGLATDYARFRTKADKSYYNGHAAGLSLHLFPQRSGWIAAAKYNRFRFEKVISSLNELNMLEMAKHDLEAEAGYRRTDGRRSAAFKLNARNVQWKGTENIFGDESSNNYPWIAAIEQYRREQSALEAAALYEQSAEATRWSLQPLAGYETEKERYVFPERKTSRSRATLAIRGALSKTAGKFLLLTDAALKQHFPIQQSISLTETEIENYALPALYRNHELRSGRQTHFVLGGHIYRTLHRNCAVFAALQWQHGRYIDNVTSNYITISCGINL
jgi:hypothetical protein